MTRQPRCPSRGMDKLWYIKTTAYCSALKKLCAQVRDTEEPQMPIARERTWKGYGLYVSNYLVLETKSYGERIGSCQGWGWRTGWRAEQGIFRAMNYCPCFKAECVSYTGIHIHRLHHTKSESTVDWGLLAYQRSIIINILFWWEEW